LLKNGKVENKKGEVICKSMPKRVSGNPKKEAIRKLILC